MHYLKKKKKGRSKTCQYNTKKDFVHCTTHPTTDVQKFQTQSNSDSAKVAID